MSAQLEKPVAGYGSKIGLALVDVLGLHRAKKIVIEIQRDDYIRVYAECERILLTAHQDQQLANIIRTIKVDDVTVDEHGNVSVTLTQPYHEVRARGG